MNQIISNKVDDIKALCRRYEVKSMYLFGSGLTMDFNKSSDIDFLIDFNDITIERYTDNYFELHYALEALFDTKIDLVTQNSLSNPYLIESIEETKVLLYAA